jgi:hypothetical protein
MSAMIFGHSHYGCYVRMVVQVGRKFIRVLYGLEKLQYEIEKEI